jgi:hypothetical protein
MYSPYDAWQVQAHGCLFKQTANNNGYLTLGYTGFKLAVKSLQFA